MAPRKTRGVPKPRTTPNVEAVARALAAVVGPPPQPSRTAIETHGPCAVSWPDATGRMRVYRVHGPVVVEDPDGARPGLVTVRWRDAKGRPFVRRCRKPLQVTLGTAPTAAAGPWPLDGPADDPAS